MSSIWKLHKENQLPYTYVGDTAKSVNQVLQTGNWKRQLEFCNRIGSGYGLLNEAILLFWHQAVQIPQPPD